MATLVGKALKGIGKGVKTAAKAVASVATSKVGKVVIGAAVGVGGAAIGLGAVSPALAAKVGNVLNKSKVGQVVNKVVKTGVVVNSKVKDLLQKEGVKVTDQEANEVSKAIADKATEQTNTIITRIPAEVTSDEGGTLKKGFLGIGTGKQKAAKAATRDVKNAAKTAAAKQVQEAEAAAQRVKEAAIKAAKKSKNPKSDKLAERLVNLEPKKAARLVTESNEHDYINSDPSLALEKSKLEKSVAKATVFADMLKSVVGQDSKAAQVVEGINDVIQLAPEVAAKTRDVFTSQPISPKFDGENVSLPREAETQIIPKPQANEASANPFESLTQYFKPVYLVYLVLIGVGIYIFKSFNSNK